MARYALLSFSFEFYATCAVISNDYGRKWTRYAVQPKFYFRFTLCSAQLFYLLSLGKYFKTNSFRIRCLSIILTACSSGLCCVESEM